jgi:thymidine phosphorylase
MAIVGADENTTLQVTGVITAAGACVAYMLAEGLSDASGGDKTEE